MNAVERWDTHPPIHTFLPVALRNGVEIRTLSTRCPCGQVPHPDYVHGELLVRQNGYEMRSIAYCSSCKGLSHGNVYIEEDGPKRFKIMPAGDRVPGQVTGSPWPEDRKNLAR